MRAYWGIYDDSNRITKRKKRVDKNIEGILKCQYKHPFVTYVFGKDNFEFLKSFGFDCVLIHPEPHMFDPLKCQYRHKLETLKYAMEVEKCDELVHIDWDCKPQKNIDENFWKLLEKKASFQANLLQYHRVKAPWRGDKDTRKIPNGGFLYISDKTIPQKLIEIWETMKGPSAEPAMAKYVDVVTDGWKGLDTYWDLFEPEVVNLHRCSVYGKTERMGKKDIYFIHYQGS